MRAPAPRAMNGGSPPTDLNARTGEVTPPGITRRARSRSSRELLILFVLVLHRRRIFDLLGDGVVQLLFALQHLDLRRAARLVLVALGEPVDGDHLLARLQPHQPNALRVAPERRNPLQ